MHTHTYTHTYLFARTQKRSDEPQRKKLDVRDVCTDHFPVFTQNAHIYTIGAYIHVLACILAPKLNGLLEKTYLDAPTHIGPM